MHFRRHEVEQNRAEQEKMTWLICGVAIAMVADNALFPVPDHSLLHVGFLVVTAIHDDVDTSI